MRELVAAGRSARNPFGRFTPSDKEAIEQAIERVGLSALAAEPTLLALDEPTTGVDVAAQEALAGLLERLHRELGVTILYVSHEFGAIEHVVQRLVLVRERIVFDGPPAALPDLWHDPSHAHA